MEGTSHSMFITITPPNKIQFKCSRINAILQISSKLFYFYIMYYYIKDMGLREVEYCCICCYVNSQLSQYNQNAFPTVNASCMRLPRYKLGHHLMDDIGQEAQTAIIRTGNHYAACIGRANGTGTDFGLPIYD